MLWQDPFEPTRSDRVSGSKQQDFSIWQHSSEEFAVSGTTSEGVVNEYGAGRFSPITWNDRRGIYESHEIAHDPKPGLGTFAQSIVALTAIWPLCELPLEVVASRTPLESAACIAGKLIWLFMTLWALSGNRAAKAVFAFCCGVSTFSIATGLAAEQQFFAVAFCLSATECALKAAAFLVMVWPTVRRVAQ